MLEYLTSLVAFLFMSLELAFYGLPLFWRSSSA